MDRPGQQGAPGRGPGRAVVVGGGISGLLAARQLILSGWDVSVVEESGRFGGCVQARRLTTDDGQQLVLDAGAESFAVRTPAVRELVDELGLAARVVAPHPGGSWLYLPDGGPGRAVRAPHVGVLGIPGDLDAPEVGDAVGPDGLGRARRDLSAPTDRWAAALAAGTTVTIGELVRDRMGPTVLETLVAPVVAGVHSADPDTLDVRTVAPRLLEAMAEHGSLARAVAAQRAAAPPGAAVASLEGGMRTLTDALVDALQDAGARLEAGRRVAGLSRDGAGWTVESVESVQSVEAGTEHDDGGGGSGQTVTERADRVVVATDGPTAWTLLQQARVGEVDGVVPELGGQRPPHGAGVALATLVVDHPGLDAAPRGTGLLVAPSVDPVEVGAKAMTHVSAKWGWVGHAATDGGRHPHRHVLRLSYGRVTDAPDSVALGFRTAAEQLREQAVEDAGRLTGLELSDTVRAAEVVRWRSALPVSTPGHRESVSAVRAWVEDREGLDVVGAWVAGTGLSAVVGDVRRRIR